MIGLVLAVAAAAAGAVGWVWWRGDGQMRLGSLEVVQPGQVALPAAAFGASGTLLLFGSQQDRRTAAVRERLQALAGDRPGIAVAEVDLTVRGDIAGPFAVTRTPTVFVLDPDRRLLARVKGAADEDVLHRALATLHQPAD
ncbi:TlpA family protein disulfide reductase [uncultured Amnibacterium sp.]|uniref:TlpA family protein disulfide reductase n=1 Tax=uncultured Amnibacterium sp. TaxID=1631851 RepID=UPI0035CAC8C9